MQKDRGKSTHICPHSLSGVTKASSSMVITLYSAVISLRYPKILGGISERLVSGILCNFVSCVQTQ